VVWHTLQELKLGLNTLNFYAFYGVIKRVHPPTAPESSGAHEWINEVPTVLAWGPVKTRSRCTGRQPPAGR